MYDKEKKLLMIRGGRENFFFTRIGESFDDSKHIVDLRVDQHVVHLNGDVGAASQFVINWRQTAFKTAACIRYRTADFPGEDIES